MKRPPILRWKVVLGLLVVVVAGVSLGSALAPSSRAFSTTPVHQFYGTSGNGVAQLLALFAGGVTPVAGPSGVPAPVHAHIIAISEGRAVPMNSMMRAKECAAIRNALRREPKKYRSLMRQAMPQFCAKHR